jgi:hypothetical protein
MKVRYGPLAMIIFGAIVVGAGILWHMRQVQTEKIAVPRNDNPLDQTMLVECIRSTLPEVFPLSGKIYTTGFWSHASTGIAGPTEATGTPGSKAPDWPPEMQKDVYLCHVTNNWKEPVFHVEMEFIIIYHSVGSGDILSTSQWPLHILQLMPLSQGGSYDLYFWNAGVEIVEITLPKTAKVQRLGQKEWRVAQLIAPRFGGFYIGPNRTP